uniref:FTH domain-containing protein n=1 Tax=Caenorhabditis tropicalis TaxID=1561998 RepID=A0A1I7U6L2_9PELO
MEIKQGLVSHSQFLFSTDENCVIVHATESALDVKMELKMKKKWPLCKVVKVNTQATPDENNQVEVVRARLKMTFDRNSFRRDKSSVDLDTLMRVFLNTPYIEALYLDEFVSVDELFQFSEQKDFAKLFPVCQLTMVVTRPKDKSDATKFWNFILYFVVDSP